MKIQLNKAQQKAVEHIYGPLLVLAGPGTGKTQLLSARIANILTKTDAHPQNILCLTFTESAAQNMRERLSSMIGPDAYDVHINTYHGFGSDIIRSYPQFFEEIDLETGEDSRLVRPIDDLKRYQIVESIVNKLPYDSPLINARYYVRNVASTISELKRGLYTPATLRQLADVNLEQVQLLSPKFANVLVNIKRFPSKADTAIELFEKLYSHMQDLDGLAEIAREELELALTEAVEINKSSPLTAWKNAWLSKDEQGQFQFTDPAQHMRIRELAKIFEAYEQALAQAQSYDFDDMILRTINALKTKPELTFNLQEKYQFILLDEFQDTNAAQFELVKRLADNPVHEGKPNIFAVGDDDQAIYAFQGARVSNMLGFIRAFSDVVVINLTENYRSHADIIHVAHNIAHQIESRLHHEIEGIEKTLTASSTRLPKKAVIERHEFAGEANENAWVANKIKQLVEQGTDPSEIAVLAPKHALLEKIVPFLVATKTPIAYEKREDILQTPMMRSFKSMIELIAAIHTGNELKIYELFPRVLSLEFYQIPVQDIWAVNWQYRTPGQTAGWVELALEHESLAPHVLFYMSLGLRSAHEPLEYMLDYLTGSSPMQFDAHTSYTSPLKNYYFSDSESNPLQFYEALTNLSTIREHLRSNQEHETKMLTAQDFLDFIGAYESAQQPLLNTHPIAQHPHAVQLMTAYKSKGLEFEHVFLLSVHDDVWGKKARSNINSITLPANLQHVRYQGSSEDELRRILFVAITRAKHGLYLTSHAMKDNGKQTEPVKYLLEATEGDERMSAVLPEAQRQIQRIEFTPIETMKQIDTMWHSRHLHFDTTLQSLLQPRLQSYQMNPTHLNSFIDMEYGGPATFLLQTLLRFPQAPGEDGEFGTAIHNTLDWYQKRTAENPAKQLPLKNIIDEFDRQLEKRYCPEDRLDDLRRRGHACLGAFMPIMQSRSNTLASSEVDFKNEGVILGEAHLSGKIDRLEIDKVNKTVTIIDFKTGAPHLKWDKTTKLTKYKQQLYFYKFLIEGSHTWQGYTVSEARLEFVEPDAQGKVAPPLHISFDQQEERDMKSLISSVWQHIQKLDFPDTGIYEPNYKGTQAFIESLLEN